MVTERRDSGDAASLLVRFLRRVVLECSIEELADRTGLHRNSLGAWERGAYKPRRKSFAMLLEGAGVDPSLKDPLLRQMGEIEKLLSTQGTPAASHVSRIAEALAEAQEPTRKPADPAALFDRLMACSPAERFAILRLAPCRTPEMVQFLCARSNELLTRDAPLAAEVAELAVAVAEQLRTASRDLLLGFAWAHLASALTAAGDRELAAEVLDWDAAGRPEAAP